MKKTPKALFSTRVFYDSHCSLCLACIRFALKRKKKTFPFCFSPIGGKTFLELQKVHRWENFPNSLTLYYMDTHQLVVKGKGVLQIIKKLKFPWILLAHLLGILPVKLLNFFYDFIAKNRYQICKSPKCDLENEKKSDQNTLLLDNPSWKKYFQD